MKQTAKKAKQAGRDLRADVDVLEVSECDGSVRRVLDRMHKAKQSYSQPRTKTPEFRHWFGDSQVVDRNSKPLVVFHGTNVPEDFGEFRVGGLASEEDREGYDRPGSGHDPTTFLGSHFALEVEVANTFAEGRYGGRQWKQTCGRVYPVFLRIENPFVCLEGELHQAMESGNYDTYAIDAMLNVADGGRDYAVSRYDREVDYRVEMNQSALDWEGRQETFNPDLATAMANLLQSTLERKGHDGIIYLNEREGGISFVAFDPRQIKSSFGNTGKYKTCEFDIRE